jgi:leucyl-tRNA synthetase
MEKYDFTNIEAKWQKHWSEIGLAKTPQVPRKKYYCLVMFAYPSGDIHMGHFRNYIIGDAVTRYRLMNGYDVLYPFGWDAFGLPAENAAVKEKAHPEKWTLQNVQISRNTLKKTGILFDWDREVTTCLPDYYKWTQWFFLKLYEKGLAYRATSPVNWCPGCKTVLANEQVEGGKCWRCSSEVTKRKLEQWFFKITAYADRLLEGLDRLEGWTNHVVKRQREWIGRSEGVDIDFKVEGSKQKFSVFTTRPDTLYGVTFMAVAPENPLASELAKGTECEKPVTEYIEAALKKSDIERTSTVTEKDGVFTGRCAINPINGEKVQLWVADYVLASYGTGIVMAVPAHDQRDFEFARKYGIPVKVVIQPEGQELSDDSLTEAYVEPGIMVNSGKFDSTPSQEGIEAVNDYLEEIGEGRRTVNYRLRDWLISRQRYWGTPIPMIHCKTCGVVPVPENELPVLLPKGDIDFIPKGRSPLEDVKEWIHTSCPKCSGQAKRDPDTMDTFVCSSWYHMRYLDAHNETEPFSRESADSWMPIDMYIGGDEHATGHLIYFRFFTKVMFDEGRVPFDEPSLALFNHGMVQDAQGVTMSKSRGNVVSPTDVMEKEGVDTARAAMFSAAPSDAPVMWDEKHVVGARRFLYRIWEFVLSNTGWAKDYSPSPINNDSLSKDLRQVRQKLHSTIKKVGQEMEDKFGFNTALSAVMELLNTVKDKNISADNEHNKAVLHEILTALVRILAPLIPHICEEMWRRLGHSETIFHESWPECDEEIAKAEDVEIVLQVNGKVRSHVTVAADTPQSALEKLALEDERISGLTQGKEIRKVIVVPGRLVNIVIK